MSRASFISFEGGEGCGKTTQLKRLTTTLIQRGLDVVATRELGGTPGAEALRTVMQSGDVDKWDAISEAMLAYTARHDHVRRLIQPALDDGKWVLTDRFFDTTTLYQGYGGGVELQTLDMLRHIAIGNLEPTLTLVFDLDPELGLERAFADAKTRSEENTRFERKGLAFHQRVREGLIKIAEQNPKRCVLIDARGTIDEVQQRVWAVVSERFSLS